MLESEKCSARRLRGSISDPFPCDFFSDKAPVRNVGSFFVIQEMDHLSSELSEGDGNVLVLMCIAISSSY